MNLNLYTILQTILNESVQQNDVEEAIQNKQVIMMTYNDGTDTPHTNKRWTEPYALVQMRNGDLALRAFQYNGDTKRGIPHWKLFKLDRIIDWKPTTSKFIVSKDGYNQIGDKQYRVIQQVQFNSNDNLIQQNLNKSNQENQNANVDYFGRKINKKLPQQGPIMTNNQNTKITNQTGPLQTTSNLSKDRKSAWKKFNDVNYQKHKRDAKKMEKLQQQNFGNNENEIMNDFDKENIIDKYGNG